MEVRNTDDNRMDFNVFVSGIYKTLCESGSNIIAETMKAIDDKLYKERDPKVYRYKYTSPKTINTILGSVTYERRYYVKKEEDGKPHVK